ncbi:MAG: glycoside hydrolase family 9 protein [Ruminococcus sp.]|nr:glycoside hydrolase family 9 protein [Ruminococcus sp.]
MGKLSKRCSKAIAIGCALLVTGTSMVFVPSNRTMTVDASSYNYARGLQYSMYLYDANMCGTEVGETSAMDWRDDCHTADSSVTAPNGTTVDVSGGYHDAGDHVKFGLPQAYSASILGWGYYEFKDAYVQTGQDSHMETISTYFAEYFKNCTVMENGKVTAFCYQVGNGDEDHAEWCAPETQNDSRQTYWATSSNPATDIVANTVGALAFHYKNFNDSESLTYAKALYEFVKSNNKACATEGVSGFYSSDSYVDDLMWAAAALYTVTGDSSYLSDASTFLTDSGNAYIFCSDWPLCWSNMWPAVNLIFGESGGVSGPYGDLQTDMANQVKTTLSTFQNKTKAEGVFNCQDNWGSARYNTAMQLVALIYDKHQGTNDYGEWAKSQMDYLLGDNKNNLCYITGFSDNSVTQPHHRAASGYTDFPSENVGVPFAHTLIGALVGGPDSNGDYVDDVNEYTYSEVAIDYNAGLVGAMAGLYELYGAGQTVDSSIEGVSDTSTNTTTTTTATTTTSSDTSSSSTSITTTSSTSSGDDIVSKTELENNSDGTDVLKIYVNTTDSDTVTITMSGGTPGATTSGEVGYWDNSAQAWVGAFDSWEEQKFDSNGNLTISGIKVPTNTNDVQIMLTYYADWSTGSENNLDKSSLSISVYNGTSSSDDTTVSTTSVTNYTSTTTTTTSTSTSTGSNIVSKTELENNSDGTDVLKIYVNTTDIDNVTIVLTGGTPGATTSGEVGYWDNSAQAWVGAFDSWEEQKFDSNGNLTISGIKVPTNTNDVQIMLTYYADWSTGSENNLDKSSLGITVYEGSTATTTTVTTSVPTTTTTVTTSVTSTNATTTTTTSTVDGSTLLGDVNCDGDIKSNDLLLLKKYLLGLDELSTQEFINADINEDSSVKSNDLLQLKKILLGID